MRGALNAALVIGVMCVGMGVAYAEKPEPIELTPNQIEINNRAVRMLGEDPPRTEEAIKLVEAALVLDSKGDLLFLTLGRAYQLQGRCAEAMAQYEAAEQAPGVKGVPVDFVPRQLREYRSQLTTTCPGTLVVSCEPSDLNLSIPDQTLRCGEPLSLSPGEYTITARSSNGAEVQIPVRITGMKETLTQIKLGSSSGGQSTPPPDTTTTQVTDPGAGDGAVVTPPGDPNPTPMSWRVGLNLGGGNCWNTISQRLAEDATPGAMVKEGELAGRAYCPMLVVDGRLLAGSGVLKYGVAGELRAEFSVGSEEVQDAYLDFAGGLAAVNGQLWLRDRVGLYGGIGWHPRRVVLTEAVTNQDEKQVQYKTLFEYGSVLPVHVNAGLRLDLGPMLGVAALRSLEANAGVLVSLSGDAYAFDGATKILPIELGLRMQLDRGFTASVRYEAFRAGGTVTSLPEGATTEDDVEINRRSEQVWLQLGWTFGAGR